MEEFIIGVLVGGFLFAGASRSENTIANRLRGYFNRKRYERVLKKAQARGIEREFRDAWQVYGDMPFDLQLGMESFRAFRQAEAAAKAR